ncbi:MAG: mandelate racemase/muconate lactonizing enzyme family protein [Magnetospirillum sp.]|nr:mandelate racemase/muconate lactonizing enzyme family protein [Magnetospirillum sp.]
MRVAALDLFALAVPAEPPVRTSFGVMLRRSALLVRARDADGAHGWGEIWCNFPARAMAARKALAEDVFAPLAVGPQFDGPEAAHAHLAARTHVLALQTGEPGTFAQVLAGIDQALWDMAARKAGRPLWMFLGGTRADVATYASGLGPEGADKQVHAKRAEGYDAFKLKIGFAPERDRANLRALREAAGPEATLMADANQAWSVETACDRAAGLGEFGLDWLEEPIPADRPAAEWARVARAVPTDLAAGENLRDDDFESAMGEGAVRVLQPDIAKWGGFTRCLPLAKRAMAAGLRFCPHYLGGAVGLAASAHLLAAAGGDGRLEIDAQPNALRDRLLPGFPVVRAGRLTLPDRPGLGYDPDPSFLASVSA